MAGISVRLTPSETDTLVDALENELTADNQYPFGKWHLTLSGLTVELPAKRVSDGRRVLTWRGEPNFAGVLLIGEKPNDTYPCGENLANLLRRSREIASIWEASGSDPAPEGARVAFMESHDTSGYLPTDGCETPRSDTLLQEIAAVNSTEKLGSYNFI